MCTHKHSWVWCYEHSWVLMSAQSLMAPCSWLLLSFHGCSLPIAHKCLWLLLSALWQSRTLTASVGCLLVLISANGCSWVLKVAHEHHSWESLTHELGAKSNEHSWEPIAVMKMAPWVNWHSSALMSAYGAIAPYSWVLMSAHERTCVIMRAQENLGECMSAELLH